MQIELDVFSGRPNPRWEMSGTQAEFLRRLRSLKVSPAGASTGDGLGYRGFVVRPNGGPVDGFDEVRLYKGSAVVRQGDRSETFSDPERSLERWLLDLARGHVDEEVLEYIRSEMGR